MEVNNDKEDNPMRRVAAKGEVWPRRETKERQGTLGP